MVAGLELPLAEVDLQTEVGQLDGHVADLLEHRVDRRAGDAERGRGVIGGVAGREQPGLRRGGRAAPSAARAAEPLARRRHARRSSRDDRERDLVAPVTLEELRRRRGRAARRARRAAARRRSNGERSRFTHSRPRGIPAASRDDRADGAQRPRRRARPSGTGPASAARPSGRAAPRSSDGIADTPDR